MPVFHCSDPGHEEPIWGEYPILQCPNTGDIICRPCIERYNRDRADGFMDSLKRLVYPECPNCPGWGWGHFHVVYNPPR